MKTKLAVLFILFAALTVLLNGQTRSLIYDQYQNFMSLNTDMTFGQLRAITPAVQYKNNLNYDPTSILYLDTISAKYQLTQYEKQLISQNGFVVTDRKRWESFGQMVADVFHKDLPMFISADMMLHIIHKSYDNILLDIEGNFLISKSQSLLDEMASKIPDLHTQYSQYSDFLQALKDLDYYITVARKLFTPSVSPYYTANVLRIDTTLNYISTYAVPFTNLFGEANHYIDFSQFKVRGHYADSINQLTYPLIDEYFKVMIWLGRTEIPLLDNQNQPIKRTIILSALLSGMLNNASINNKYTDIDQVITTFVGDQDNLTVPNFNLVLANCGINNLLQLQNQAALI